MAMRGMSARDLCSSAGIGLSGFYRKMRGVNEFTQGEIASISRVLNLSKDDMCGIFFEDKVS